MSVILVRHDGAIAAFVSPLRAHLVPPYDTLPDAHPDRRAVLLKCRYAIDVASGRRPGPYDAEAAERLVRLECRGEIGLRRPGTLWPGSS